MRGKVVFSVGLVGGGLVCEGHRLRTVSISFSHVHAHALFIVKLGAC